MLGCFSVARPWAGDLDGDLSEHGGNMDAISAVAEAPFGWYVGLPQRLAGSFRRRLRDPTWLEIPDYPPEEWGEPAGEEPSD
jgi:hypothetical protein